MARSTARGEGLDLRLVTGLALAHGVLATGGLALAVLGAEDRVGASVLLPGTLLLLGLAVELNGVLRLQGLADDGLAGAAGVLGAALVVLGRVYITARHPAADGGSEPAEFFALEVFTRLELVGFVLVGAWAARSGWLTRRLVARSADLGWGCVVAGLLAAAVAGGFLLRGDADLAAAGPAAALVRGPTAAFSLILAWMSWRGRPERAYLPSE